MDDDTTARGGGGSVKYASQSYALSGKIMLSAIIILFAVVILIVCLHIYARWFLTSSRRRHRRRHRRTRIVFTADLAPVVSRGLDPAVLKSLPTHLFSSAAHPDGLECAVCLSEFEEQEKTRLLPKCNHSFHTECIDMWFYSHDTCPLCRVPVNSEAGQSVGEAEVQIVVDSPRIRPEDEPSSASSSSSNAGSSVSVGPRKKVGISIEVPRRNESFKGVDEEINGSPGSQGFRTPGGRILSFKRILGRERKGSTTPLSCSSSAVEIDPERGEEAERERSES